jgi:hypothetical protein
VEQTREEAKNAEDGKPEAADQERELDEGESVSTGSPEPVPQRQADHSEDQQDDSGTDHVTNSRKF